jgi:hypothetical protein
MNSVECGYEEKGAAGISGILGVTDSQHSKTRQMLCQEHLLRSDRTEYRIRPMEEKHPALLPVGQEAEFRIIKDRMHLRVPELDGREREYLVVSITPRTDVAISKREDGGTLVTDDTVGARLDSGNVAGAESLVWIRARRPGCR